MIRHARAATGKRIVIADDEAVIRMGVRCILEDAGHSVVGEASSGSEALKLVPELSPDLVVLDIRMTLRTGSKLPGTSRRTSPCPSFS